MPEGSEVGSVTIKMRTLPSLTTAALNSKELHAYVLPVFCRKHAQTLFRDPTVAASLQWSVFRFLVHGVGRASSSILRLDSCKFALLYGVQDCDVGLVSYTELVLHVLQSIWQTGVRETF